MSRSMKVLLGVSLALNLLLIGFMAGRAAHRGPPRPFNAPLGMMWMIDSLPEQRRAALEPLLRDSFADMRPHLRGMRDAQQSVADALARPQFDRAEFARALAAMQAHMRGMENASQSALMNVAAKLSADERRLLAATLMAPPWPGPRRHFMHRRTGPHGEGGPREEDGPHGEPGLHEAAGPPPPGAALRPEISDEHHTGPATAQPPP